MGRNPHFATGEIPSSAIRRPDPSQTQRFASTGTTSSRTAAQLDRRAERSRASWSKLVRIRSASRSIESQPASRPAPPRAERRLRRRARWPGLAPGPATRVLRASQGIHAVTRRRASPRRLRCQWANRASGRCGGWGPGGPNARLYPWFRPGSSPKLGPMRSSRPRAARTTPRRRSGPGSRSSAVPVERPHTPGGRSDRR
jgi:hypothetical protein